VSGFALAIIVAVIGIAASIGWFGVLRRRKAELEFGISALANMKFRDCLTVVLEALHRDGYQRSVVAEVPAGASTEVMLTRNGQDVLLDYKHGTAYHLGEANVREFVNDVSLNGAREGVLVTLGTIGPDAAHVAATHAVQLIDGATLWPKVRHYVVPSLLEDVRRHASSRTNAGLWTGIAGSVLLGAIAYVLAGDHDKVDATVADADVAALSSQPRSAPSDAAMLAQINATAKAMEEVAKLTPEQRAARRAAAAHTVSDLPRVGQANWSAQSTLLVNLEHPGDEAKDSQLLDEICRILVQNEEMRFTRVQLESESGAQRVRWRLCEYMGSDS
jgi:hypothetical protein